ncbi:MAG: metal-dependent transcriptional regulator [Calditrichaeota bacterium]|nr:metal-dependent transcriptional regulator [Calditrichota bacterium]
MIIDPLSALSTTVIVLIIILILFWPDKGIVWQLQSNHKNSQRVIQEDALKQIYDHEYRNKSATLRSVAGALGFSMDKTSDILDKLMRLGLVSFSDAHYTLTAQGRSYALRVIRLHRLWERYYADETGFPEKDWHKQAEKLEHSTTPSQAAELAQSMGNPLFDPHGDPIPTIAGDIIKHDSLTLNSLKPGNAARITHIEDEPAVLYSQLVASGLYPGMHIYITEKGADRVRFVAEGEEIVLAPVLANHINVQLIPEELAEDDVSESLINLNLGESAEVTSISKACRGIQRRRLMDLGIIPGTKISAELTTASGNPTAYNIRGAMIALRHDQAKMVKIRRTGSE